MKDRKSTLSTVLAIIIALCTTLATTAGLSDYLPDWVLPVSAAVAGFCTTLIGIFQGRNADLSRKTSKQLKKQAVEK